MHFQSKSNQDRSGKNSECKIAKVALTVCRYNWQENQLPFWFADQMSYKCPNRNMTKYKHENPQHNCCRLHVVRLGNCNCKWTT